MGQYGNLPRELQAVPLRLYWFWGQLWLRQVKQRCKGDERKVLKKERVEKVEITQQVSVEMRHWVVVVARLKPAKGRPTEVFCSER